ncbi:MAG: hypothetical protein E7D27_12275 [Clostridium celatum]|nr:hypothetical protein [Clostridium celatum]
MYKVLVVTHSNLCKGFSNAVKMILGEGVSIRYLALDEDGVEVFHNKLKNVITELKKESNEILILADLFGGSPFNTSLIEMNNSENIKVISGVNLPMLIEAIMNESSNLDEVVIQIVESGKDSIKQGIIQNNINSDNE